MSSKIYVVCNDVREFKTYVNAEGKGEYYLYQYVDCLTQILGKHGIKIIYYGNYQLNPVYKKYYNELKRAEMKEETIIKKVIRTIKGKRKS